MCPSSPPATTRHVVSINDLTNAEIEKVFEAADEFLSDLGDSNIPYRIGRSTNLAQTHVLASLFYEPSTRTRLSFESAMARLGGKTITSADPTTSSAAKGESLADTVRVLSNYADLIVVRHPRDGAARLAAEYASVPVVNGGDGSHEHPTQTLCDLFTLKRENNNLRNLKVAISGDLKGSRTIHSFVYALARFGAVIQPLPAKGMELPRHVDERLREEFQCQMIVPKTSGTDAAVDALYVTPDGPHQPSLFAEPDIRIPIQLSQLSRKKFDALYVTRFQKERWKDKDQPYPKVDSKFLRSRKYAGASVLHPLPRVGELDVALDSDARAKYFEQAAYGVPIRMALMSLLLGLADRPSFERFDGGFRGQDHLLYRQPIGTGLKCANPNCIVHEESEQQYLATRFFLILRKNPVAIKLRCFYCENDIEQFVIANRKNRSYDRDTAVLHDIGEATLRDIVFFASEEHAKDAGYHPRRVLHERRPSPRKSRA